MGCVAPRITYGDVSNSTTLAVASGEPVYVYGITFCNTGTTNNLAITARRADDSTAIMVIPMDAADSREVSIPFYAEGGIEFIGDGADLDVTIHHSSPGAQGMREFAPTFTYDTGAVTVQAASGNPVNVYGIVVSSDSATSPRTVTIRTADGNATTLAQFGITNTFSLGGNIVVLNIPFCADKGIEVVVAGSDPLIYVTIFHSNTGT